MNIELHQTDTALSEADIHDILRNDRRRNVIKRLQEHGREISLRELSVHIAEIEAGESPPPSDVRNSVYVSLHQTHLPKLDKEGIVEYDNDQKTIVLQESARQVSLYMEVITQYGHYVGDILSCAWRTRSFQRRARVDGPTACLGDRSAALCRVFHARHRCVDAVSALVSSVVLFPPVSLKEFGSLRASQPNNESTFSGDVVDMLAIGDKPSARRGSARSS